MNKATIDALAGIVKTGLARDDEPGRSALQSLLSLIESNDAARYRWLRDPANQEGLRLLATCSPEELDAAIDAALAKPQ